MTRTSLSAAALMLLSCAAAHSQVFTSQIVDANANIFGAGYNDAPAPGGGGGGVAPPSFLLSPGTGRILTFDSVTGVVSCCGDLLFAGNGPDGGTFASGDTNILGYRNIGGVKHDTKTMFLMGIVTNGVPGGPMPTPGDWTADSFFDVFVQLDLPFFVGDGLTGTGSGSTQQFHIPDTATHLWLGFADAYDFGNPVAQPGFYHDNIGELTASFRVTPHPRDPGNGVPEPGTTAFLVGVGTAAAAMLRRGRR